MMFNFLSRFMFLALYSLLGWVLFSDVTFGASFECNRASTKTEIVICSNSELSALDSQLGKTFLVARSKSRDRKRILSEQRLWITERDEFCSFFLEQQDTVASCVKYMIRKRIAELLHSNSTIPRKIYWGSRAGMHATVVGAEGINSRSARIFVEHRFEDAEAFCVEYGLDFTEKCVLEGMEEAKTLPNMIAADCYSGQFTSLNGMKAHFLGRNQNFSSMSLRDYLIAVDGAILDGSMASGYDVMLESFRALCPKFVR